MTDNYQIFLTIAGMGLVTYLTRISGFFIFSRIQNMPPRLEQFLRYIPGTIIVSIIAPQMAKGGSVTLTASAVCIAASLVCKNLVAVMVIGVVYVSLFRYLT